MSRYFYTQTVFVLFCVAWALSGLHAATPANWLAESKVLFLMLPPMAALVAYTRLSRISVTLIGIFLVLHVIAMHFNYGDVPFGFWLGHLVHSSRNMYDRFVHFFFGFFLFYPVREVLLRFGQSTGLFNYFLSWNVIVSFSAIYEIMEWHTVAGLSTSIGYLFIGGNDPFDSAKDMAMAAVGALAALVIVALINAILTNDFWKNIRESLRLRKGGVSGEDFLASRLW